MVKYQLVILISYLSLSVVIAARLRVCSGNSRKFCYNGKQVYLSGMNQAWKFYAHDFGNGQYSSSKVHLESTLKQIHKNGGNSIRIWLHTTSALTPRFNSTGHVVAADHCNNHIISEMKEYLCAAERYNIVVFFVLWNGADPNWWRNYQWARQFNGLITVDSKLQSYIDNALIPIVKGLKTFSSLGGYEIINEPEGILFTAANSVACFDASRLAGSGAGFAAQHQFPNLFYMHRLQRFINWQANAIKTHDPNSLVTVGSWRENPQYNNGPSNTFNYYSDHCLIQAGGRSLGTLDFYQIHTYAWNGAYSTTSPMVPTNSASLYQLNKPLVIGEFSHVGSDGTRSLIQLVEHAYNNGYAGAWSWHALGLYHHSDPLSPQLLALDAIRWRPFVRLVLGVVNINCRNPTIGIFDIRRDRFPVQGRPVRNQCSLFTRGR
ncbi:mannan endo-1,4-beta-mannosidase-like [Clavelina lepadiformis]|uniref:mannan endo-1,4-beta-mannosidase-like n=1 Tax=Clavelina lepadiformis TaxID=159417 RepID=UPI0040430CC0